MTPTNQETCLARAEQLEQVFDANGYPMLSFPTDGSAASILGEQLALAAAIYRIAAAMTPADDDRPEGPNG